MPGSSTGSPLSEADVMVQRMAQDYVWGWVQLCAQQRMTLFNFGVAILGGIAYVASNLPHQKIYLLAAVVAVLGMLAVSGFANLDRRNSQMTKQAERHLRDEVEDFLSTHAGQSARIASVSANPAPPGTKSVGKVAQAAFRVYWCLAAIILLVATLAALCPFIATWLATPLLPGGTR